MKRIQIILIVLCFIDLAHGGDAPAKLSDAEDVREKKCLSIIKMIGTELQIYAMDYDGRLPRTIEELFPTYLTRNPTTTPELRSPFAADAKGVSYELVTPGAKLSDLKPETVILRCKFHSPAGRRSVYLASGKGQTATDK